MHTSILDQYGVKTTAVGIQVDPLVAYPGRLPALRAGSFTSDTVGVGVGENWNLGRVNKC